VTLATGDEHHRPPEGLRDQVGPGLRLSTIAFRVAVLALIQNFQPFFNVPDPDGSSSHGL